MDHDWRQTTAAAENGPGIARGPGPVDGEKEHPGKWEGGPRTLAGATEAGPRRIPSFSGTSSEGSTLRTSRLLNSRDQRSDIVMRRDLVWETLRAFRGFETGRTSRPRAMPRASIG